MAENQNVRVDGSRMAGIAPAKLPYSLSDEYRKKLGELLDIPDGVKAKIEARLKKEINNWINDTGQLHRDLMDWNDQVEGVVEDSDFPWVGASNVHVPITGIYMQIFHTVQRRSILGSDLLWYSETLDDSLQDILPGTETAMNYYARSEWNISDSLNEVFWTTDRDGLGVMQVPYVEEYEPVEDILYITSPDDFLQEFPTPEDAGLSEPDYMALQLMIEQTASEENPVEIPVTYEKCKYKGPKGEIVELAHFVTFPANVKDLDSSRGHGKRFTLRRAAVKKNGEDQIWYADAVTEYLKTTKRGSRNSYDAAKDQIEGIGRTGADEDPTFFELVMKLSLAKNEPETKVLLVYSHEIGKLMACRKYPYRVDFYALFRIEKRPGRLIGVSIPYKLRDIQDEVSTMHNQRVNSRTITSVPSFKARNSAKGEDFDPQNFEFFPGCTFWMDNMEDVDQWKIQPVDLGESMQEESNDLKLADLFLGSAASLLSGQVDPRDPSAPGNKTAIQVGQSNMRMDDPLSEMREGVEMVGQICLSHMYQFGPPLIPYKEDIDGQSVSRELQKRFLRQGITMKMHGITVVDNPDVEMKKWLGYYSFLIQEPLIAQSDERRVEILRRALRAGRVPGRDKILPPIQEIIQHELDLRKATALQMQQEQAVQQQQAQQDQTKQAIDQVKTAVSAKKAAMQAAQAGMGAPPNGTTPNAAVTGAA